MRVLHTADLHAGITRYATPGDPLARLRDVEAVLDRLSEYAADAHLVVLAGDTFNTRAPTPRAQSVVVQRLAQMAEDGSTTVVVLPGNHDGMWTIGDPRSHTLAWLAAAGIRNLWVPLRPTLIDEWWGVLVAMPYPHKRAYDTLYPDMEPIERHRRLSVDLESAITGLHDKARAQANGRPVIFAGHLTAVGATVGSERAMRLEDDVAVSSGVLDLFDYAALGHIHKRQPVGTKGWYPGSPLYIDWGESGQTKAFLMAHVEAGQHPLVETMQTGARPMWEVSFPAGGAIVPEENEHAAIGPLVRLMGQYRDRAQASGERRALVDAWYRAGAAHVQWDPEVEESERTSDRALPASTEPLDAVSAYFVQRGLEPGPYLPAARAIMEGSVG